MRRKSEAWSSPLYTEESLRGTEDVDCIDELKKLRSGHVELKFEKSVKLESDCPPPADPKDTVPFSFIMSVGLDDIGGNDENILFSL